ncbi:reverse transcriptase domain-containing protein, partial [Tanacetum coccineum]
TGARSGRGSGRGVADNGNTGGEDNSNEENNEGGHEHGNLRNGDNNNNGNKCSYKEFLACQPKEFDGKGGELTVKYAAGLLTEKALTWWNTQVQARGRATATGMVWDDFKTLLKEEYCTNNEMQKLENEFWNHTMVRDGHAAYVDRFCELAKPVPHLVTITT